MARRYMKLLLVIGFSLLVLVLYSPYVGLTTNSRGTCKLTFSEEICAESSLDFKKENPESKAIQELRNIKYEIGTHNKVKSLNKTCPAYFPSSLAESLNFLLGMKTDKVTEQMLHQLGLPHRPPSIDTLSLPEYVRRNIQDKIPTIVCAASSNHYSEAQALFYHIDTKIRRYFPDIKVVFYDIGLSESEVKGILNYGRIEYRKFNFARYPLHAQILHSCVWKPIIIQEVLREVGYIMYLDTSLRPHADTLQKYFNICDTTGHVFRSISLVNTIVAHTFAQTFTYFNVLPCLFHAIPELESGYMIIKSDSVISMVIMRAWLTCALQKRCIMPRGAEHRTACGRPKKYHLCHRGDQSALGIATFLIYHELNKIPIIDQSTFETKRGEQSDYFEHMRH